MGSKATAAVAATRTTTAAEGAKAVTAADNDDEEAATTTAAGNGDPAGDTQAPATSSSFVRISSEQILETAEAENNCTCPGLGLFYSLLASAFFSVASLLVKKIEDIHSVEISAIRYSFQLLLMIPITIYFRSGFLGPKDMRIFLLLRGFIGSSATILLYYAVQVMPLADATVITFSSPVFTSIFACIFLKEMCTIWDIIFNICTITGVVLIARPPFLFGSDLPGIEGDYSNHLRGTIVALTSAVFSALTLVLLRKMGKSAHYMLSIWYYTTIGLTACVIVLSVLGEWRLPNCGLDRWLIIVMVVFGLGGQIFLTKALQIEKAGPVAIMRTMDVVFAFIFQFLFLSHSPTWWSVGGAFCVVASTAGTAIRKWYAALQSAKQDAYNRTEREGRQIDMSVSMSFHG
ncbi:solute carrier family 35 member G1-like [Rhinatrema bivittatum]|uniref:solute carrier family 35 member G1-like n=1 Tax=Rhinatrema bivittatum TaxID=194408 RepID=UPI0011295BA5|nr:solute carrier family 35 member G1-like [Rhinatrema bivittatum]